MAQATTTVLGDIALGGDLAGNNNALAPELTSIAGLTAGQYIAPKLTIDAKGRTTEIVQVTPLELVTVIGDATLTTKGVVQIGSGLNVTSGLISIADATTNSKGVIQVGSGLNVTGGLVSVDIPTVVANIPDATTNSKGVIQVGSGLAVNAGVLSLNAPDATTNSKGVVQVGAGMNVTGGVISIVDATTNSKGIVQIGSGLAVNAGVVTLVDATNSVKGGVTTADSANITITTGQINTGTNIPKLNTVNIFTKAYLSAQVTTTYAASWAPNLSLSNAFFMTLSGNLSLLNPTNMVAGGVYKIVLRQDNTGARTIAYDTYYKFASGAITTLSTTPNYYDVLTLTVIDASNILCTLDKGYV